MKPFFVDSFSYIALINPADAYHNRAREQETLLNSPTVTTEYVLVEFANALPAPRHRLLVSKWIRTLQASSLVSIVPAGGKLFELGLHLYRERPDKFWSLTDCISFVVMEEQGITEALTGDKHFEQAGFTAVFSQ